MKFRHVTWSACAGLVCTGLIATLAACGGGGGGSDSSGSTASTATSSGAITAFGSVFVNGHEFSTLSAKVVDDDSGATAAAGSGLEIGMVVDVKHAKGNTSIADELHVHPLARGYVDASDATAGTVTVMGQTVQITSATNFSDRRACASATTSPCPVIAGQTGLTATTSTGGSAVPGNYVTVHGYLFNSGSSASTTNIVATLISVADAPATTGVNFKAEGVVTATGSNSVTIGGLNVDLSSANCYVAGTQTACASAYGIGQVVSAIASAAPSLPATTLVANRARLGAKLAVDTAGTTVEVEGSVSSVTASPAAFVVRGVSIDASALPSSTSLPSVGDVVRVSGTVAGNGQSVAATSLTVLHVAASKSFGLEGDASNAVAGSSADTYTLSVLGQTVTVNAKTRLADRQNRTWSRQDPASNPFNISTFLTYLNASTSKHVLIQAEADASGNLTALSLAIVPASTTAALAGVVDASPAPVNSSTTGTPSTFAIHGVAISADPTSVLSRPNGPTTTVAAGHQVLAVGSYASGTLTITAAPTRTNEVIDIGMPTHHDHDGF